MRYQAVGFVLGVLACDGGGKADVDRALDAPPPAVVVLSDRDLDAYVVGTRFEIRHLREAIRSGRDVGHAELDSVGARAAAMPVDRFRALTQGVETALKQHTSLARGRELDSLRIDLLLLRVRAEGRHE